MLLWDEDGAGNFMLPSCFWE